MMAAVKSPVAVAANLLAEHGVVAPPVPVHELLPAGVRVGRTHFDGDEAGFVLRDTVRTIGINTNTSSRRQRFALAHQLGHLLLHTGYLKVCTNARTGFGVFEAFPTAHEETDANLFAVHLLLPPGLATAAVQELKNATANLGRDALLTHLAQRFDVSAETAAYQLYNLGVICT